MLIFSDPDEAPSPDKPEEETPPQPNEGLLEWTPELEALIPSWF